MSHQLVITHDPEELSLEDAIITDMDYSDGFRYCIQDILVKTNDFKKFITELEQELGELKEYDYSKNKNQIHKKISNDKVRCYFKGNSTDIFGQVYSISEEISNSIWKIFIKNYSEDDSVDIFAHTYCTNGSSLESYIKLLEIKDLNYISDKYYPYIDTNIMFNQFFTGTDNILIVVGEPGYGKSKLSSLAIKHAYENTDKLPYDKMEDNDAIDIQFINIVFVKSTDVLVLDKFWREIEQNKIDLVIIDDLDYMLTKRDSEVMSNGDEKKNVFLNQFLSYTDGVEKNKTKFIITTNQNYEDIDTALLRKGRLFDILELRKLDKEEAFEIWKENGLSEKSFETFFKSHEICPADLGAEINKRLNKRIKNSTESYLKESGISKIQKAGRSKRISL